MVTVERVESVDESVEESLGEGVAGVGVAESVGLGVGDGVGVGEGVGEGELTGGSCPSGVELLAGGPAGASVAAEGADGEGLADDEGPPAFVPLTTEAVKALATLLEASAREVSRLTPTTAMSTMVASEATRTIGRRTRRG
ncbi:hypothetical protein [Kitasatospora kifunensis]|uniref:Uncharacterized protein n=1 Tax=Kitasatospora kifunensis TaxID=58351 RepID=A0A7W7VVC8_KITKI|nr:hypothetical protein [Kitasatospora kifunensis]MBB4923564.1 hypothetical protein [Kitasatospora kifunensis]